MKIPQDYISRLEDGENHLEVIEDLIIYTAENDPEEFCGEVANGWIDTEKGSSASVYRRREEGRFAEIDARIYYDVSQQMPGGCADRIESSPTFSRFIFCHTLGEGELVVREQGELVAADGS